MYARVLLALTFWCAFAILGQNLSAGDTVGTVSPAKNMVLLSSIPEQEDFILNRPYLFSLYGSGVDTYNIANPLAPRYVSAFPYAIQMPLWMDIGNNLIAFASVWDTIEDNPTMVSCGEVPIYDIRNPAKPVHISSIRIYECAPVRVAIHKNMLLVWVDFEDPESWDSPGEVQLYDISNPKDPKFLREYDYFFGREVSNPAFYGDLLCFGYYNQLILADISQPGGIRTVGSCATGGLIMWQAIDGHWVYLVEENMLPSRHKQNNFRVIDISDPKAPRLVGSCTVEGGARCVAYGGGLAYIAARQGGIQVVDVTDPAHPAWRGSYPAPYAKKVVVSEGLVYAWDCGPYSTPNWESGRENSILIANYVPQGAVKLSVLNRPDYRVDYYRPRNLPYVDQAIEFTGPGADALREQTYIMTRGSDRDSTASGFVSFNIDQPATVYVAYDARAQRLPSWLKTGWRKTGLTLRTTDGAAPGRVLYSKKFPVGRVGLGGNRDPDMPAGANVMYSVIVQSQRASAVGWEDYR